MSEQSIATVRASVMVYDDTTKKWIPSGSSGTQGVSKVQIFHHYSLNTFRVVGRKLQDHEVVINCAITRGLKYNQTTATFHQWRDQRQVYGLNFVSSDDAGTFANSMLRAIEVVTASVANAGPPATPNTPTPRDSYQNGVQLSATVGRTNYQQSDNHTDDPVEVCYSVSSIGSVPPAHQQQHVRRSSQGSNSTSSSSGSSVQNSQSNIIYSSVTPNAPGSSPSRPAPAVPPPPPAPPSVAKTVVGNKPASTSSSAPPPPPLPPGGLSSQPAADKPVNLAQAIASAKLKKTTRPEEMKESRSASVGSVDTNGARLVTNASSSGPSDLISEMAATLARRRMMIQEGQSSNGAGPATTSNGADTESPTKNAEKDAKRPWESRNGRFDEKPVNDSPKTHRNCFRVPSGSSLSSQEEGLSVAPNVAHAGTNGLAGRTNGPASAGAQQVVVTQEYLEQFRQEILNEVRSEITKAKVEIIEALKIELNRR